MLSLLRMNFDFCQKPIEKTNLHAFSPKKETKIYADCENSHLVRFRLFDENQFAINHKSETCVFFLSVDEVCKSRRKGKKTFIF